MKDGTADVLNCRVDIAIIELVIDNAPDAQRRERDISMFVEHREGEIDSKREGERKRWKDR